ncbi:type II secretion system protein E [Anopheles sinensis]|uniref:Type II secretion system protein E n=1 Tax=Anopheles sinensis TaxID=74873 RepID=A0A084W929_ANOSI|nr:type II secretion system protein E [Anopheles sinensis]
MLPIGKFRNPVGPLPTGSSSFRPTMCKSPLETYAFASKLSPILSPLWMGVLPPWRTTSKPQQNPTSFPPSPWERIHWGRLGSGRLKPNGVLVERERKELDESSAARNRSHLHLHLPVVTVAESRTSATPGSRPAVGEGSSR